MIFIITNQAGIGRGYYTVNEFLELSKWMCKKFDIEGAPITKIYFSPFHPVHGIGKYKKNHISRKPNPGMIYQAEDEFNIDLSQSILVGDKLSDINAGLNAGVSTNIYIKTSSSSSNPDYECISDISEVKSFLVR